MTKFPNNTTSLAPNDDPVVHHNDDATGTCPHAALSAAHKEAQNLAMHLHQAAEAERDEHQRLCIDQASYEARRIADRLRRWTQPPRRGATR